MAGESDIQDERLQRLSRRAVAGLLRASDRVRRAVAEVIEPHGITGQQYNVLRILRGAHPEALPTLQVADRVLEKAPGITRMLDRLERKGLVVRTRPDGDRRKVICAITEEGLALLAELDGPVARANLAALEPLGEEELRQLAGLLDAVTGPAG